MTALGAKAQRKIWKSRALKLGWSNNFGRPSYIMLHLFSFWMVLATLTAGRKLVYIVSMTRIMCCAWRGCSKLCITNPKSVDHSISVPTWTSMLVVWPCMTLYDIIFYTNNFHPILYVVYNQQICIMICIQFYIVKKHQLELWQGQAAAQRRRATAMRVGVWRHGRSDIRTGDSGDWECWVDTMVGWCCMSYMFF